jgi:hypothetical protein
MGLFRIARKLCIDPFAAPFTGVSPADAIAQSLRERSVLTGVLREGSVFRDLTLLCTKVVELEFLELRLTRFLRTSPLRSSPKFAKDSSGIHRRWLG